MKLMITTLTALSLLACSPEEGAGPIYEGEGIGPAYDSGADYYEASGDCDCEAWCSLRAPKEEHDGWCPVDGWSDGARTCVESCQDLAQSENPEHLQECIEGDALCFSSMEQCLDGKERLAACDAWCEYRAVEHANDGFCDPCLQGGPETDCQSVCISALWEELPAESVEDCLRDDPLCFVFLEDCASS